MSSRECADDVSCILMACMKIQPKILELLKIHSFQKNQNPASSTDSTVIGNFFTLGLGQQRLRSYNKTLNSRKTFLQLASTNYKKTVLFAARTKELSPQ